MDFSLRSRDLRTDKTVIYCLFRCKANLEQWKDKPENTSSFAGTNGPMHLKASVFEIIIAGTETTSTFIEWTLLYLIWKPDVQEKMAEEIEQVTHGRTVTLEDKESLPYCCAFLEEVYRYCPGKEGSK